MADNPIAVDDRFTSDGFLVAGDTYTLRVKGGSYELTVVATSYGAGDGIVLSRIMPDGTTLVPLADLSANPAAPQILQLASGRLRLAVAADVTGAQLVFGRCG